METPYTTQDKLARVDIARTDSALAQYQAARDADKPIRGNAKNPQDLAAFQLDDALLKVQTVAQIIGMSPTSIYRKLAAGDFPEPVRIGPRCTRWRAADIRAWISSQGGAK